MYIFATATINMLSIIHNFLVFGFIVTIAEYLYSQMRLCIMSQNYLEDVSIFFLLSA